jgi:hypothetical protein
VLSKILDGNGLCQKAMPGSIPAPNSGSILEKIRKIKVAKWSKPTKNIKKIKYMAYFNGTVNGVIFVGLGQTFQDGKE